MKVGTPFESIVIFADGSPLTAPTEHAQREHSENDCREQSKSVQSVQNQHNQEWEHSERSELTPAPAAAPATTFNLSDTVLPDVAFRDALTCVPETIRSAPWDTNHQISAHYPRGALSLLSASLSQPLCLTVIET